MAPKSEHRATDLHNESAGSDERPDRGLGRSIAQRQWRPAIAARYRGGVSGRIAATAGGNRGAIEKQDARTLQRAAHTLKGSTGYFGAARASEMALQLETMGKKSELAHAQDALVDMEREMARLTPVLVDYMRGRFRIESVTCWFTIPFLRN